MYEVIHAKCLYKEKLAHQLYSLQKVEKSLDTRTWLGRDRHAKAPAKLKAFCSKEERVTGRLSCFVVDGRVQWVDGVSRRHVRYGGDREFKHLYIV